MIIFLLSRKKKFDCHRMNHHCITGTVSVKQSASFHLSRPSQLSSDLRLSKFSKPPEVREGPQATRLAQATAAYLYRYRYHVKKTYRENFRAAKSLLSPASRSDLDPGSYYHHRYWMVKSNPSFPHGKRLRNAAIFSVRNYPVGPKPTGRVGKAASSDTGFIWVSLVKKQAMLLKKSIFSRMPLGQAPSDKGSST